MTWTLNHLSWIAWMIPVFSIGFLLNYIHRGEKWQNERDMRIAKERGEMLRKSLESRFTNHSIYYDKRI